MNKVRIGDAVYLTEAENISKDYVTRMNFTDKQRWCMNGNDYDGTAGKCEMCGELFEFNKEIHKHMPAYCPYCGRAILLTQLV